MKSTALHHQVHRTIRRHDLCPPGARVLVALSGGSDSVALLWLLKDLSETGAFTIAAAAHLNHQLRPTAGRDEEFCRQLADRAGLHLLVASENIAAYAADRRLSLEDAARRARYTFLSAAADQVGADRIATGHTLDDQTETFLLKLLRGAGAAGLAGIHPRRGSVIRPLLAVTRADLRTYLVARRETWMEDETNAELRNPRNRIRHVVLPHLERVFSRSVRRALGRAAGLARADAVWLDALAAEHADSLVERRDTGLELGRAQLRALPDPIAQRVVLRAMREMAPGREVGLDHVEAAFDVLNGLRAAAEVPGGRWELLGEKLVLFEQSEGGGKKGQGSGTKSSFSYLLDVPGSVTILEAGCLVAAERLGSSVMASDERLRCGRGNAAVIAGMGASRLRVRNRRPGDRLPVPGLGGSKKLQDLFVDAKVPRLERDRVPVIVTTDDRIVWVPGHAISSDFEVSGTEHVILLKLTPVGGKT